MNDWLGRRLCAWHAHDAKVTELGDDYRTHVEYRFECIRTGCKWNSTTWLKYREPAVLPLRTQMFLMLYRTAKADRSAPF